MPGSLLMGLSTPARAYTWSLDRHKPVHDGRDTNVKRDNGVRGCLCSDRISRNTRALRRHGRARRGEEGEHRNLNSDHSETKRRLRIFRMRSTLVVETHYLLPSNLWHMTYQRKLGRQMTRRPPSYLVSSRPLAQDENHQRNEAEK